MEGRMFNFSAGPAVLPLPVLKKAQEELLLYPGAGASVMEISHRSKAFAGILERAKADMKALLGIPDNYHVLFCPGGATLQFTMLAMNFLGGKSADYIMSGSWASKAAGESRWTPTARFTAPRRSAAVAFEKVNPVPSPVNRLYGATVSRRPPVSRTTGSEP